MNQLTFSLCAASAGLVITANAAPIELISAAGAESPRSTAAGLSLSPKFSPDGSYLLFSSSAADLVGLPKGVTFDLFAVKNADASIQLVSLSSAGLPANGTSEAAGMSRDNRFVLFESTANDLTTGDANFFSDIYLRDLQAGTNWLVTRAMGQSVAANERSRLAHLSEDGEWIVFESEATNLIAEDTNGVADIFAWRHSDNSMRLVSTDIASNLVVRAVGDFTMTPDGRFVLFEATAGALNNTEVYVRDLQANTTRWVSRALTNGISGVTWAGSSQISRDGQYVFMVTLQPSAANTLVRVDLADDSAIVIASKVQNFSISDDGLFAAFSNGTNVFRWRASGGVVEPVDIGGSADPRLTDRAFISHDGSKVAFLSTADELLPGLAGNDEFQWYLRDMTAGTTRLVTARFSGGVSAGGNDWGEAIFSPDDHFLVFDSSASDLVEGDRNGGSDIFSWNIETGNLLLVSSSRVSEPEATTAGHSSMVGSGISADGRFVAFTSLARLHPNDTNDTYDIYVRDRLLRTNILVSAGPDGFTKTNLSRNAMISADGTKVAFESDVRGLAGAGDDRAQRSIYVRDLTTGQLRNVSGNSTAALSLRFFSANGNIVVFTTGSNAGFRWRDVDTGVEVIAPNTDVFHDASADGRLVLMTRVLRMHTFEPLTGNLVLVEGTGGASAASGARFSPNGEVIYYIRPNDFFVTNRITGITNSFPTPRMMRYAVSADGRTVAYQARPPTTLGKSEIRFIDTASGQNTLISAAAGTLVNGDDNSEYPTVSADGQFIAFESWATDLVANDNNNLKDVFIYDVATGQLRIASHARNSNAPGNSVSANPYFNTGGSDLFFFSAASDLITRDFNDSIDLFVTTPDSSRLRILEIRNTPNGRVIAWSAVEGRNYRLEFKNSLDDLEWQPISVTGGVSSRAEAADPSANGASRFYRVRELE